MSNTYFEQLHREEMRHDEWRMLDEALETRNERHVTDKPGRLRTAIGHLLMRVGARLAGEPLVTWCETTNGYHSLN